MRGIARELAHQYAVELRDPGLELVELPAQKRLARVAGRREVRDQLGVRFEFVTGRDWTEVYGRAERGEVVCRGSNFLYYRLTPDISTPSRSVEWNALLSLLEAP